MDNILGAAKLIFRPPKVSTLRALRKVEGGKDEAQAKKGAIYIECIYRASFSRRNKGKLWGERGGLECVCVEGGYPELE